MEGSRDSPTATRLFGVPLPTLAFSWIGVCFTASIVGLIVTTTQIMSVYPTSLTKAAYALLLVSWIILSLVSIAGFFAAAFSQARWTGVYAGFTWGSVPVTFAMAIFFVVTSWVTSGDAINQWDCDGTYASYRLVITVVVIITFLPLVLLPFVLTRFKNHVNSVASYQQTATYDSSLGLHYAKTYKAPNSSYYKFPNHAREHGSVQGHGGGHYKSDSASSTTPLMKLHLIEDDENRLDRGLGFIDQDRYSSRYSAEIGGGDDGVRMGHAGGHGITTDGAGSGGLRPMVTASLLSPRDPNHLGPGGFGGAGPAVGRRRSSSFTGLGYVRDGAVPSSTESSSSQGHRRTSSSTGHGPSSSLTTPSTVPPHASSAEMARKQISTSSRSESPYDRSNAVSGQNLSLSIPADRSSTQITLSQESGTVGETTSLMTAEGEGGS